MTLDVFSRCLCRGLIDPRITASNTRKVLGRLVKFFSAIMLFLCLACLSHYIDWIDAKRSANTKEGIQRWREVTVLDAIDRLAIYAGLLS